MQAEVEAGLGQVQEKNAKIKRLQRELEGYESQQECVQEQMVMELDDKKRTMDRFRAGKKKFKVRTTVGRCILDAMSCILLPSQAGKRKQWLPLHLHRHMEETKEEMKSRVR